VKNDSGPQASDADHSERVIELFEQARELPPEQRAAFLAAVCGEDEELRRELESLLEHAEPALPTSAINLAARQLADDERQDWTGQQINQYRLLGVLGEGGMGKVYLAEDGKLGRRVAIKFLPETFLANASQLLRFEQEARAASALNHPNIITIHEIGQHEGAPYIAYELVEGQTLRQRIRGTGLDWQEAIAIGAQIAAALKAAHSAGIIHRDIKPENVLLRADGLVKVLDFGIAKRFNLPEAEAKTGAATMMALATSATQTGQILGTIGYLSPEQARGEGIEKHTDIFSLGVLMFELLTGERPFAGATPQEQIAALLSNEEAPDVRTRCPRVPAALAAIVAKALRKSREERYDKAGEMLADLEELKNDLAVNETREQIVTQSANRLLTQFTILSLSQPQTRIPFSKLWTIWRRSDLKRGAIENRLMLQSLRGGLLRAGAWALLIALIALGIAAAMSVTNQFGDERVLRDGHTAGVRRAAFSPVGLWLVSVSVDNRVIVWDFARRELKKVLKDHQNKVVAVAFSPDGKYFATASWDRTVIVWDAARWEKVVVLREQSAPVTGVAFSPEGKYIAAAAMRPDARTVVWRVGNWEKVRELSMIGGDWVPLLFSPNQPQLLLNSWQAFNVETGQEVKWMPPGVNLGSGIEFSRDGLWLVTAASGGQVTFFDALHWKIIGAPHFVHRDHGRGVAFSPDGRFVATGSEDVILWDTRTQGIITRWACSSYVWSLSWSPNEQFFVSTHGDGSILIWDVNARECVGSLNGHSAPVGAVAFSPDGQLVASGSEDCSIILWNAAANRKEGVLLGHKSRINALTFAPDGTWLASLDQSGILIRWDAGVRREVWRQKNTVGIMGLAISPDGRLIARSMEVYESETGRVVYNLRHLGSSGGLVSFSGDGRSLVVTTSDTLRVFDTQSWAVNSEHKLDDAVTSVCFARDGQQLVTGDISGAITLWQAEPLRPLATLGQHKARIKQVAFAPDGLTVAAVGDDNQLKLWNIGSHRLAQEIGTHTAPTLSVAFSPNGQRIVTGEHDKSVRVYTRHRTLWGWRLN
jgi:WD40 repeat protein/serine/threonine protein kinase